MAYASLDVEDRLRRAEKRLEDSEHRISICEAQLSIASNLIRSLEAQVRDGGVGSANKYDSLLNKVDDIQNINIDVAHPQSIIRPTPDEARMEALAAEALAAAAPLTPGNSVGKDVYPILLRSVRCIEMHSEELNKMQAKYVAEIEDMKITMIKLKEGLDKCETELWRIHASDVVGADASPRGPLARSAFPGLTDVRPLSGSHSKSGLSTSLGSFVLPTLGNSHPREVGNKGVTRGAA